MTLKEITDKAGLKAFTKVSDKDITGCYIGDIMSLAMCRVKKNNIWITAQCSMNTIAVAVLTGAAGVIVCEGFDPEEGTAVRADEENIAVFGSHLSAYELAEIFAKYI